MMIELPVVCSTCSFCLINMNEFTFFLVVQKELESKIIVTLKIKRVLLKKKKDKKSYDSCGWL